MSDIIDNKRVELADVVKDALRMSERADVATGYFFLPGLSPFVEELPRLEQIRLVIGQVTSKDTVDFLAYGTLDEAAIGRQHKRLDKAGAELRTRRRSDVESDVASRVVHLKPTVGNEETLHTLLALLRPRDGKPPRLSVRVHTRARLHAKCYLFDFAASQRNHVTGPGMGIVGSSNLTLSGLKSNTELNVRVHGESNHRELKRWFEDLWNDSEEFDKDLMEILENSWAIKDRSHFDIWSTVLDDYVGSLVADEDKWNAILEAEFPDLALFQREAVEKATQILERYQGVFVSDVVGLGKSYVGAYLLKRWTKKPGYQAGALVVSPAPLVEMWEDILSRFGIPGQVVSTGKLSTEEGLLRRKYGNLRLVLVDESHNFRNTGTNRYAELADFTQTFGRKCVLLTATPLNRSAEDIKNQLRLFHPANPTELPVEPNHIDKFFKGVVEREKRLQAIREDGREPSDTDLAFHAGEANLRDLLKHILIRRTRRHIEKNYDERTAEEVAITALLDQDDPRYVRPYFTLAGRRVSFPTRKLKTETYSIDTVYEGVYDDIVQKLRRLKFARYSLGSYVRPERQGLPDYEELGRAGRALLPLVKIGLMKRFESSVQAFRSTIGRMHRTHNVFLNVIAEGKVPVGKEIARLMGQYDWDDDEDLVDEVLDGGQTYPAADFDVETLLEDIKHDASILSRIAHEVAPITVAEDDKLNALKRLLDNQIADQKLLIFTEYRDTAVYLHEALKGRGRVEQVDSGTKNRLDVLRRFSPVSNNATDGGEPIQVLIATDVFSEGLNLQDCSCIVNFDLHWNPVRLIQRIGRVDRIGSKASAIHVFNFLPEVRLEQELGIQGILQHRIQEIHNHLGEDEKILTDAEKLNEDAFYAIYERGDIESIEAEVERHDLFSIPDLLAEKRRLDQLRKELRLPKPRHDLGARGRRRQAPSRHVAVLRAGDVSKFFVQRPDGEVEIVDDELGLSLMRPAMTGWAKANPTKASGMFKPGGPVTSAHRAFLERAWQKMEELRESRRSSLNVIAGQSVGHQYVRDELQHFLNEAEPTPLEREQAGGVIELFDACDTLNVRRQLRRLKDKEVVGRELLRECLFVVEEQNLVSAYQKETPEEPQDDAIRLVASLEYAP